MGEPGANHKATVTTVWRACRRCGALTLWKRSDILHGRGNYCSRACYAETRRDQGAAAFWSHVKRGAPQQCWPWVGGTSYQGYGRTRWRGRSCNASRAAWMRTYGEIDALLQVCHLCDNPSCCNPHHLFLDTNAGNQFDKAQKGRATGARPDGANRLKIGSRWTASAADGPRSVYVRVKSFRTDAAQRLWVHYVLPSGAASRAPYDAFLRDFCPGEDAA